MDDAEFRGRYGPWAVVIGASEGVGAAFAQAVAERGLHVVLVARRADALEAVAASVRSAVGVEARVLALDLTAPDTMDRLAATTADVEVGLVLYGAGADSDYRPFLSGPVDPALALVQRNCVVPLRVCHHFAGPMVERGPTTATASISSSGTSALISDQRPSLDSRFSSGCRQGTW